MQLPPAVAKEGERIRAKKRKGVGRGGEGESKLRCKSGKWRISTLCYSGKWGGRVGSSGSKAAGIS